MTAIKVSKLEVARDQLDAAIELFFISDNAIAVHTLTAAAYNVLRDLAKREGSEFPFIKSGFIATLNEHERGRVLSYLNGTENFFKHADRDPEGVLEFDSELTELLLMDACSYFKEVPSHKPRHFDAIKVWSGTLRADVPENSIEGRATIAIVRGLKASGKKRFWDWYCALGATGRASQKPRSF